MPKWIYPKDHLQPTQPARYQVKIQGRLDESWSDWMDDLKINVVRQAQGTSVTIMTGVVRDQAGLHGLLNRIRDLGMAVASLVLGYLGAVDTGTQVGLLSLGLFTLAVAALQDGHQQ